MNSIPIPFYANTPDDTRCVQACFRMALKHFLSDTEYTWEQMDTICHAIVGKGTWWFPALIALQTLGLQTKMISSLDYKRLQNETFAYLEERTNEKIALWYKTHSNLSAVAPLLPIFLQSNIWKKCAATLEDIDHLLQDGWLVGIELNARLLNGKEGLSPHMTYTLHDPGLPARKNHLVTREELLTAWQYAGVNNTSLIGLKK